MTFRMDRQKRVGCPKATRFSGFNPELDGKNGWRVELSLNCSGDRGGGCGRSTGSDLKCYECGEHGHLAWEYRSHGGSGRSRSRSPRYRKSPRGYSPRRRSSSPCGRSVGKSPGYQGCVDAPYANG